MYTVPLAQVEPAIMFEAQWLGDSLLQILKGRVLVLYIVDF